MRLVPHDRIEQKREENQFSNLFTHAHAGIALVDKAGHLLTANRAFCEATGMTESALKSSSFLEAIEDRQQWTRTEALLDVEEQNYFDYEITSEWTNKSGESVDVTMLFSQVHFHFHPKAHLLVMIKEVQTSPRESFQEV